MFLKRLDDITQLLSRCEYDVTCSSGELPLTSRTAESSSMRAWRSWKTAGLTMPDCDAIMMDFEVLQRCSSDV